MEQTMIKTENLSKRFGSFALQDIHFELPAGYICGLIGENGAGKTTLLNILSGLYEYDGTVCLEGEEYRANQMELQQEIAFEKAENMVGRTVLALIEGKLPEEHAYVARTYMDAPNVDGYVFIDTDRDLMSGTFVKVKITGSNEYDLIGEMCDESAE